jgi:cell division protein FtsB
MKRIGELKAENARLKAEVERLRKGDERDMTTAYLYAAEQSKDTIARLKAEVERLTSDIQMEKENEDRLVREWQKANNEVYGLQTQVAALIDDQTRLKAECQARQAENSVLAVECDSLKAEVERLTKAGDAMASGLQGMAGERPKALADEWNDAKEGKQS